jgi:exodeoxyribonuclease-3
VKIISWNVNGLRSVCRKGFWEFLKKENPGAICLQEIKIDQASLSSKFINPLGYYSFYNPAIRKGYAGTAVFTKAKPKFFTKTIGFRKFDEEGRAAFLEFPNFKLANVYMPHGGRGKENFPYKFSSYKVLFKALREIKPDILIGDFNIAHTELDLGNPKQNKDNTMFTSKERRQLDKLLSFGYKDSFRLFTREGGHYSWWPYWNNLRQRNIGWRIDYVFVTTKFASKIKKAFILEKVIGSDHCPIGIEI